MVLDPINCGDGNISDLKIARKNGSCYFKKEVYQLMNTDPVVELADYNYNELRQLVKKYLHGNSSNSHLQGIKRKWGSSRQGHFSPSLSQVGSSTGAPIHTIVFPAPTIGIMG